MLNSVALRMTGPTQVGEARRAALKLAAQIGFDATGCGRIALVVTEAANNLVKHARNGTLLLQPIFECQTHGLDVLALDQGPGMADVRRCLRDGYSTAGTPGTGLGAIVRQSEACDIFSRPTPGPGSGTALVARFWTERIPETSRNVLEIAAVRVAKEGETSCGDAWMLQPRERTTCVLVVDGLGHGPQAAEAAEAAVQIFCKSARLSPVAILQDIHRGLFSTRGAAAAVAEIDLSRATLRYAGVGNIAGAILTPGSARSLVTHNGTLGHVAPSFQEFDYPFPTGATLVMHSDGLASRWNLDAYPGLLARDPALLAGILYRDFQRGRDDATVLVARRATEKLRGPSAVDAGNPAGA